MPNYHPNLPFIGKLLEWLANKRLINHFNINNLNEDHQSAYKTPHSTKSALLKVHCDISTALSVNKACLLVLLDLLAAFDTIDIDRLICGLDKHFGVVGKDKAWSYLSLCSHNTNIDSCTSDEFPLQCGIPQGSVLGPILFNVYTAPLETIVTHHEIHYLKLVPLVTVAPENQATFEDGTTQSSLSCICFFFIVKRLDLVLFTL